MTQSIKTFLLAMAISMTGTATFAQDKPQGGQRPSPEAMMEQRANSIAKQMGLDAKTTKKFISVFKSEQRDMRELMPKRGGMPPRGERPPGNPPKGNPPQGNPPKGNPPQGNPPKGNPPAMNGKSMDKPKMSEEEKQKMAKVREKYNKRYAKFFSQAQIAQMYKLQEQERANHQPKGKHKKEEKR